MSDTITVDTARLPPGKTLDSFDFAAVPTLSRGQIMTLAAGDSWLEKGPNLLAFGPPGSGKSPVAAALGHALVENGFRVLFTPAPPISPSAFRPPARTSASPRRSTSSTSTTC